jgi:hypothetical protein
MGSPKITEKEGIAMTTMITPGSPEVPAVRAVPYILGLEGAIQLSPLTPEESFTVLQSAVASVQPVLRNVFRRTFREIFERLWEDIGPMPDLPPGLDTHTKCVCIGVSIPLFLGEPRCIRRKEPFIVVTRNGGMFLWDCDMTGEHPVHRVVSLSEEVFLQEWGGYGERVSTVVSFVIRDLAEEFRWVLIKNDTRVAPIRDKMQWLNRTNTRLVWGVHR